MVTSGSAGALFADARQQEGTMRYRKRWAVLGGVLAVGLAMAPTVWACVPEGTEKKLNLTPAEARPGQQITVAAAPNGNKNPVVVRLNAPDGPVLATIAVDGTPIPGQGFESTFTVPLDLKPGQHALIPIQEGVSDWRPTLLSVLDERGMLPQAPQWAAEVQVGAPAPDESIPRGVSGVLAVALAGLAVGSAVQHRRGARQGVEGAGLWHRVQPSALALVAGAAAYSALRPRLDGSLLVLGLIALAAGLVGRGRTHFIPVGLVLAFWGAAVWLVSEGVIPGERSQAAAVAGLGLGMLLSAKLARSPEQRTSWLYTGALCTFNAGFSYYVLYDLPGAFAEWSAFASFLLVWAMWEQYRAGSPARATPVQAAVNDEVTGVAIAGIDSATPDAELEPSLR